MSRHRVRLSPADSLDASIARTTSGPFERPRLVRCVRASVTASGVRSPRRITESVSTTAFRKGMVRTQSCSVRVTVVTGMDVPGIMVTSPGSRVNRYRRIRPRSLLHTLSLAGTAIRSSPQSTAADSCEKTPCRPALWAAMHRTRSRSSSRRPVASEA